MNLFNKNNNKKKIFSSYINIKTEKIFLEKKNEKRLELYVPL